MTKLPYRIQMSCKRDFWEEGEGDCIMEGGEEEDEEEETQSTMRAMAGGTSRARFMTSIAIHIFRGWVVGFRDEDVTQLVCRLLDSSILHAIEWFWRF